MEIPDAMMRRRNSCVQPTKLQRKFSDPVRIRSNPAEFLKNWNAEEETDFNVFSIFEPEFDRSIGSIRIQIDEESAFSPRDIPKDYGKAVCLATYRRRARRRHSLQLANNLPETADPLRQKLVQQFGLIDPVITLKRCSSEVLIESDSNRESFRLQAPPAILTDKRVSFGADHLAEQIKTIQKKLEKYPSFSEPRPILVRSLKTADPAYPLQHMDYNTFKAWRRGSRMSLDLRGTDSRSSIKREEHAEGKSAVLNICKALFYNCLRKK